MSSIQSNPIQEKAAAQYSTEVTRKFTSLPKASVSPWIYVALTVSLLVICGGLICFFQGSPVGLYAPVLGGGSFCFLGGLLVILLAKCKYKTFPVYRPEEVKVSPAQEEKKEEPSLTPDCVIETRQVHFSDRVIINYFEEEFDEESNESVYSKPIHIKIVDLETSISFLRKDPQSESLA